MIIKNIFTASTSASERLATLYLMYAMYFKQPTKDFCKFRFTINDWRKMKSFYDAISIEPKYLQARTIFWRLWQGQAFRFVEFDREHYPETMQLHRLGNDDLGDFQKINATILSSVREMQNENKGLLGAIGTLQLGYNEMKEHFASTMPECRHLKSIDVIDGVNAHLNKIKKLFENKYESRVSKRKPRDANTFSLPGPSSAIRDSETEEDSEFNASCSSLSESNDEQDPLSERSDSDQCLNIGSKRYYLKRKALQKESGDLHRLKSSVLETSSSPKKKQKASVTQMDIETEAHSSKSASVISQKDRNRVSINDNSGNIVINHAKRMYKRGSKSKKSTVRRQFLECPT